MSDETTLPTVQWAVVAAADRRLLRLVEIPAGAEPTDLQPGEACVPMVLRQAGWPRPAAAAQTAHVDGAGQLVWQWGLPLAEACAAQWAAIKAARDLAEVAPYALGPALVQVDPTSIRRMEMAVRLGQAAGPGWTTTWTLADNTQWEVTLEQLQALLLATAERSDDLHRLASELREQINLATTHEAVAAITWPAG